MTEALQAPQAAQRLQSAADGEPGPPVSDPAEGSAPLVCQLVQRHGAQWIGRDTLSAFLAQPGDAVLFLHGDPIRFPEVLDVAVVLPELRRCAARPFAIGVATRADEDALAARFGSVRWPSLIFLRGGRYVACVSGMQDWQPYLEAVNRALSMAPSRAPITLHPADAGPGCH